MKRARFGLLCLLLVACSGDDTGGAAPKCVSGSETCDQTCDRLQPCPTGFFCSAQGSCAQDCAPGHSCANGTSCSTYGTCGEDAGVAMGDGSTRPGACADQWVTTTRTTPTVILIIDQSSSMEEDFDGAGSRWDVLRDFLLEEPGGLISDLQSQVHFGLALYSAESGGTNPDPIGECPMVTTVAPMVDNFGAIEAAYADAEPIEDTPTGDSIDKIVETFGFSDPDDLNPIVFVLATDGEPDRCEELDPQNGQEEAIAAVQRAYGIGIRTFIIAVGDEVSADHQQDVANAGLGRAPGDPDAEYWVAGDDQTLRDSLTAIVGGQLGCEILLNGSVTSGDPCDGTVRLNGEELLCNDENGWELTDPRHIRLLGTSCDLIKSGDDVALDVVFPCSVDFNPPT